MDKDEPESEEKEEPTHWWYCEWCGSIMPFLLDREVGNEEIYRDPGGHEQSFTVH